MAGILRQFVALDSVVNLVNQSTLSASQQYPKQNQSSGGGLSDLDKINGTITADSENITSLAMERERIRTEFYATYDVMTGIRIAATLSGFFALMIVLVLYKSRSNTNQAMKDPKIVAVAASIVMEEEERELQETLHETGLTMYCEDLNKYRTDRLLSLGNLSAPPMLSYGFRLPQSGGFGSIIESPRRFSYGARPKHISGTRGSTRRKRSSYEVDEEDFNEATELENDFEEIEIRDYNNPASNREPSFDSRRYSSITCCSTESSFLERRCSALTLGIYSIGPSLAQTNDHSFISQTRPAADQNQGQLPQYQCSVSDFSVNPSSQLASTSSGAALRSDSRKYRNYRNSFRERQHLRRLNRGVENGLEGGGGGEDSETTTNDSLTLKRAPLASFSSFKISSVDYQDSDLRSLGSDSVFRDSYVDTDEEIDQFSSDTTCDEDGLEELEKNVFLESISKEKSSHDFTINQNSMEMGDLTPEVFVINEEEMGQTSADDSSFCTKFNSNCPSDSGPIGAKTGDKSRSL